MKKMENFVLRNRKRIIGLITVGLVFSLTFGLSGLPVVAQEEEPEEDITVSAVIEAWINLEIAPTELELGQLVLPDGSTEVGTDLSVISVGTNSSDGWNLQMQGTNDGLFSTDADHTIASVTERTEIVAGTDGYGAAVEALAGYGDLTIDPDYDFDGTFAGPIQSAEQTQFVSRSEPNALEPIMNFHVFGAADQASPSADDYQDVITITASTGL